MVLFSLVCGSVFLWYGPIDADDTSIVFMMDSLPQPCPTVYAEQLECPITYEEILTALRAGARNKAPGIGGLGLEFYTSTWDTIKEELRDLLNRMFLHKLVSLSRNRHCGVPS